MPELSLLAVSFGASAQDYDRYRMGPPTRVLDWLLPAGCPSALDLGAGTGLLTRRLAERVEEVVAVEPKRRKRVTIQASPTDMNSQADFVMGGDRIRRPIEAGVNVQ